MKVCPVCKSRCFDDMEVCYGCLYKFKNEHVEELSEYKDLSGFDKTVKFPELEIDPMPEYFELETFPNIEDVEQNRVRGAHEKQDDYKMLTIKIPVEELKKYIVSE